MAEDLHRRLAEDRKVEGGPLGAGVSENDLLGERRLSGAGTPRENVERVLWKPSPKDGVKPRHTSVEEGKGRLLL